MKTFLSILILTSLALAQFTGTSKRGDATYNIEGLLQTDLSASNGVVYSERNFSQKIVKNIATLQAYDADSLGTIVYLKEVATGGCGGGEMVYVDSTDLETRIGCAVPDSIVVFSAPTVDRVWVRKEGEIDPYYRNGNWGTITKLYASLPDNGGVIFLPGGRYDIGGGHVGLDQRAGGRGRGLLIRGHTDESVCAGEKAARRGLNRPISADTHGNR